MSEETTAQEETKDNMELKVEIHKNDGSQFNLKILADESFMSLTTYPWSHRKGNYIDITMFHLSLETIKALSDSLLEQYYSVKQESK